MSKDCSFKWMFSDKTKTLPTLRFIKKLYPLIQSNLDKTYLVMDNHTSHKANIVKQYISDKKIKVMYLPSYSSDLNPCEWVWKLFKDRWYRKLYALYLNPLTNKKEEYTLKDMERIANVELRKLRNGHDNFCRGRIKALCDLAKSTNNKFL